MNETRLIARLLAIAERFGTGHGHLDNREQISHLGRCTGRRQYVGGERVKTGNSYQIVNQTLDGTCAASCQEWQTAVADARAYVAAHETTQAQLWEVVA